MTEATAADISERPNRKRDSTEDLIDRALRTEGGHLSIGRGGFSLHFGRGCTLSGYDCKSMKATCIACGLPVIDSRQVPFDVVFRLAVRGPMIAVGQLNEATRAMRAVWLVHQP